MSFPSSLTAVACFVGCVLWVAIAATPASALAGPAERSPSAEEQARFSEGMRLLQAGDARGAERAFKAGYAVAHDPAFLVRTGEAEERAGAPREAVESYARYLREAPAASDREDIEQRIHRLAPPTPAAVKPAADEGEAPGSLPGAEPPAPLPAPLPPPVGGASPAPAAPPAPRAGAPRSAQARDDEELRALVDENPPPRSRVNVAAWISSGVTLLLLGTAGFYGAKAGEKNGDVNRLLGNFNARTGVPAEYATVAGQYEAAVRDGQHDDRMAKGFAVAAGVAAATSIVLFVVDAMRADAPSEGRDPHLAHRHAPTSAASGLGLGWSF